MKLHPLSGILGEGVAEVCPTVSGTEPLDLFLLVLQEMAEKK